MNKEVQEYLKGIGSEGGKARAKKLSKEQLSAIGRKGVEAKKKLKALKK